MGTLLRSATLLAIGVSIFACRPDAEQRLRDSGLGIFGFWEYVETDRQAGVIPDCGRQGIRCCTSVTACEAGSVCSPERFCVADDSPELTANLAYCGGNGEPCCPGARPDCVADGLCTGPDNAFACRDGGVCDKGGFCRPKRDACDYATCNECALDRDCGWCSATSTCLPGRASGPEEGICGTRTEDWKFSQRDCESDSCVASRCEECTGQTGCGWCGNDVAGTCRVGNNGGPDGGSCNSTFWRSTTADCGPIGGLETVCQPLGGACATNVECCDNANCRTHASSPGRLGCCREKGQPCSSAADCCGALSCGAQGRCEGVADGGACLNSRDCMTGLCWNGRCNVSSQPDLPDRPDVNAPQAPTIPGRPANPGSTPLNVPIP